MVIRCVRQYLPFFGYGAHPAAMALACTWGGYADTDVTFASFFGKNHTVAARFLSQYPFGYIGPVVSVKGKGTYLLGQDESTKLETGALLRVGTKSLSAYAGIGLQWHHLAAVRTGSTYTLYFDGVSIGAMPIMGTAPTGTLRFGNDLPSQTATGGRTQFFGLIDDVAVFTRALSAAEVAGLSASRHLSGTESGLLAGWTFGYRGPRKNPLTLARPITVSPAAAIRTTSPNRDDPGADLAQVPLALTAHMNLPLAPGGVARVIQGWHGVQTHNGAAVFGLDLVLDDLKSLRGSRTPPEGMPFNAAAPGRVDAIVQTTQDGAGDPNFITVEQAPHEFCDYLNSPPNSAFVAVGSTVRAGQPLAPVGHTGTDRPHLHIAVTTRGRAHRFDSAYATIPAPFSNYELLYDTGGLAELVVRGVPQEGQLIRRPLLSPVRWAAVWRPGTVGEQVMYDAPYDAFRARYDEIFRQGWRLRSLVPYVDKGEIRYAAVWRPDTANEVQVYGWAIADVQTKYSEMLAQGWHLTLLQPYVVNGQVLCTAAWQLKAVGYDGVAFDVSATDIESRMAVEMTLDHQLAMIHPYVVNGAVRYTAVWRPGTDTEYRTLKMPIADFKTENATRRLNGWRLQIVQPFALGGDTFVTAIWRTGVPDTASVDDWQRTDVEARHQVLSQLGNRLERLQPYVV